MGSLLGFGIAADVQDIGEGLGRSTAQSWGKGQTLEVGMFCGMGKTLKSTMRVFLKNTIC